MSFEPKMDLGNASAQDASASIPFWKRIEAWLDRLFRLTPPLDPNEVDGILLEDRILYSATPMAILDGGENAPPQSSFTPEMIEEAIAFFEQINQASRVDEPSSILPESEDSSQEDLTHSERSNHEEGQNRLELPPSPSDPVSTQDVLSYLDTNGANADIDYDVLFIDRMESGFEQIESLLAQYDGLDAMSIVSESDSGGLDLGHDSLTTGENQVHDDLAYLASQIDATTQSSAILLTRTIDESFAQHTWVEQQQMGRVDSHMFS
ncbi:MAG: DUF4347 domain-containing protein [Pirellula sp.]|nr:DUF4347 domain-containing protein [Pirellula sp.]